MNKQVSQIKKGDRVRIKLDAMDINGEPHPMRGCTAEVKTMFGLTMAGFDCEIVYDEAHHADFAQAFCSCTVTPVDVADGWTEFLFCHEACADPRWADIELVS